MRVKFRRLATLSVVLLASTCVGIVSSRAATATSPTGLPLYQFVQTGTRPLPWNAVSLATKLNGTTMIGGPHGATNATEGVLAYRTSLDSLALLTQSATGTTQWSQYAPLGDVPTPAADPVPFFDPSGKVDLIYVDVTGDVVVLSPNESETPEWLHHRIDTPWQPFLVTNLSALSGITASTGLASIQVSGTGATVAYRTTSHAIEVLALSWSNNQPVPLYDQSAVTIASSAVVTTSTTTTTLASTSSSSSAPTGPSAFASDPVVLPGPSASVATTLANGALLVLTNTGPTLSTWTTQNLTVLTGALRVSGTLGLGTSASSIDLAALTSGGSLELFTATYTSPSPPSSTPPVASLDVWNSEDVSTLATGAPPLAGSLTVSVTPTQVAVAGQAAHWGDLFVLTNAAGSTAWSATDVSVTAGTSARTVGTVVTSLQVNGQLTLYAAGVSSPPPEGVGVYAIPASKWSTAIAQGWPIVSDTGGLGTQSAPWVGFTGAPSVASSPDFLLGQSIYNSHKRVTWLSFWTVSGPLSGQPLTTTNFYAHGFAAGVWVGDQLAAYRGLGVGLSPDWVILDPEGYPDNHSHLDAPPGASKATLATYATYWASMLSGWQAGLTSVIPSVNAGIYASQSEYRNYKLSTLSIPVFIAVAFGDGGPIPVPGASGSNVRGFISFGAVCNPPSTLASEASTLLEPPWSGQFNTLQFNAGVYCAPPAA